MLVDQNNENDEKQTVVKLRSDGLCIHKNLCIHVITTHKSSEPHSSVSRIAAIKMPFFDLKFGISSLLRPSPLQISWEDFQSKRGEDDRREHKCVAA